jgi:hypothetical protein
LTDQAPSAATLAAVRRLNEYAPPSEPAARKTALRLWPKADPIQLETILTLWKAQRRPVAPSPSDVITLSSVAPIGVGGIRADRETE